MILRELDRALWIATVYLEAEGESYDGKLAVAWVIRNRAELRGLAPAVVCMAPLQFSCWNTTSPRRLALGKLHASAWEASTKAVLDCFDGAPDPTGGATHYLNVAVVLAHSKRLPSWCRDPGQPTALDPKLGAVEIGAHTFLYGVAGWIR